MIKEDKKINQFLTKNTSFDFDETLVDSNNIKSEAFKILFKQTRKREIDS